MSAIILVWRRLWALMQKEFVVMFMDKGTRKILIVPLLAQSLLFGYGATFNLERVPYIIFQDSFDHEAVAIVQKIHNTKTFELVKFCTSEQCYKESLDRGEALLGIYIKSDFEKNKVLYVATDARNTSSANTALSYIVSIVNAYNSEQKARAGVKGNVTVEYRYLYNEQNLTRFSIMTGMILALSMIQVMMLSALSVSREREDGTFDMMLMAPLTPLEILIGKAIPPTIIAVLQGLGLFLICTLWFEIPFNGQFWALVLVISIFSLCTVGLGLAISAFASTSQQSLVASFIFILPAIILSGLITPRTAMPELVQYITLIDPFYSDPQSVLE